MHTDLQSLALVCKHAYRRYLKKEQGRKNLPFLTWHLLMLICIMGDYKWSAGALAGGEHEYSSR